MPGHVVFLECYPHVRGGAQTATAMLARGLPEHEWTAEVVSASNGPAVDAYRAAGIHTTVLEAAPALLEYGGHHGPDRRVRAAVALPAWWRRLARHLEGVSATLLDVADERGVVLGAPAAQLARTRGIWHVHTPGHAALVDRYGRWWARRCIAPSRAAAAMVGKGTDVIAPAVEADDAPEPSRPARSARVVTTGRLHPVKGFDVLLEATRVLASTVPGVRLDIYGAPQPGYEPHERALHELTKRLDLDGVVQFRGHQPSPWRQWDDARVYVQPSRDEPFGLALIEAMACGLPVVATATAGPRDIVEHDRTGILGPPGDVPALAGALERLLRDDELAGRLGAAGRDHVRATYTAARFVAATAAVYEDAVR